jgi:hypothetical protein
MEHNMNLQELRRLVNSEYRKAINEGRYEYELPIEDFLRFFDDGNEEKSHQDFETLVASELLERLRDGSIDFDNVSYIAQNLLDDREIKASIDRYDWSLPFTDEEIEARTARFGWSDEEKSTVEKHSQLDREPEITIDGVMEELTKLMDDSDY